MNVSAENAIHQDALEQSQSQDSGAASALTTEAAAGESANVENANTEPPKSARELAMERIAAGRADQLAAEGVDIAPSPPAVEEPRRAVDSPALDGDGQLAAQIGQDERPSVLSDLNARVRVKVDGEEMELPIAEVVKSYQKDATATRRLQEATQLLRQAEERAAAAGKQGGDTPHNDSQGSDENADEALGRVKQIFSKLYEGDEESAAREMLALVQGARATQTIDPVLLTAQVKQQLAVESAYGEVQTNYPALFENTERGVLLGGETVRRMNEKVGNGLPRHEALKSAAQEVADMFGIGQAGRSEAPQRTARDEKLERKQRLDQPSAASVAAGSPQSPAEAQNVSSVIAQMAAERLGQTMRSSGRVN